MPLQTRKLVMVALGTSGETRQALVEAIHLRWAFRRDAGFPWHGFFLFRRNHIEGGPSA